MPATQLEVNPGEVLERDFGNQAQWRKLLQWSGEGVEGHTWGPDQETL